MPIMTAEAELMRKKVLVARVATGVVLGSLLVSFCYAQWSQSEAGIVANAEGKLKNDHRPQNIAECLETAARLTREGKKQSATQIELAVDRVLESDSKGSQTATAAYLGIARMLQEKGDDELAYKYAFGALKAAETLPSIKNANGANISTEVLSDVQSAAAIILRSKHRMTKDQAETAVVVAAASADSALQTGSDSVIDLAIKGITDHTLPPSDATLTCLFAKDLFLAKHGQTSELEKTSARSIESANKLQDATTLRKAPEPCLLTHLIELSATLQPLNPGAAAKYMALADGILPGISRVQTDEESKSVLADALCKMSSACEALGDKQKALETAKDAASVRTLQDAASGAAYNQLISAMAASNQYRSAQSVAADTYKFFKAQDPKDAQLMKLKAECAVNYFRALVGLNQTSAGIKLLKDELKDQKSRLPGSAQNAVMITTKLADYHLKRRELKLASECISQIPPIAKKLSDQDALAADMTVINYAAKAKSPELTAEACSDALERINKTKLTLNQKSIDGLCLALDNLRKAEATDLYQQVLEKLKDGCLQQLVSNMADPISLANVVNELGTSGEAKTSDLLRSQAVEKLSESQKAVFLSHSMDFVVSGQDSNEYAEPLHAAGVYLDMAHSMQGKDNESAFKNAFEALKIYNVIGTKQPELREQLLETIDEAAGVMMQCKQAPTTEQLKVLHSVCSMEEPVIRKSSKGRILDLVVAAELKNEAVLTDELIDLIELNNESLARRALYSQLQSNISKSQKDIIAHDKSSMKFANHLCDVADVLAEKKEQLAARRYLNNARRLVEEETATLAATQAAAQAATAGTTDGTTPSNKLTLSSTDTAKHRDFWNRLSLAYGRVGDAPSALSSAKKSVAYGGDGRAANALLFDRLLETRNYAEAEPLALEAYRTAKARAASPQATTARASAARKLFVVFKEQKKDELAIGVMREELDARRQTADADAFQTAQLYFDLANFYASRGDSNSATACLTGVIQNKARMTPDEKARWERSGLQREIINLALQTNDSKLASEQAAELVTYKSIDKASATRGSSKWWSASLLSLKTSDQPAYQQMVEFLTAGFNGQLGRGDADPAALGKMLTELMSAGEEKTAVQLRDRASRKLSGKAKEIFAANCKGLPAEEVKPNAIAEKKGGATDATAPAKTEPPRDLGGRLDPSD